MNRRDFLLLRADSGRAMELSCQRLYMWYLDTQITHGRGQISAQASEEATPWGGEPPAVFEERTVDQLFQNLRRDLLDVKILRVRDREWLIHEELSRELETLIAAFRLQGGRVEFID